MSAGAGAKDIRFDLPSPPAPGMRLKVAVLVSGAGTTLQNFVDETRAGRLPIDLALVVSSKEKAFALERARRHGIPGVVLKPRAYASPREYGEALAAALADAKIDLACMAGWLAFWEIPPAFLGRVLNIHPALLPAFGGPGMYGDKVHASVLEHGCKVSGCTVHIADNEYDHGPIVLQRVVPVLDDDTPDHLRARVFAEECVAYPQAIRLIAEGRLRVDGRRVCVVPPPVRTA